jgi:hypothetical protein
MRQWIWTGAALALAACGGNNGGGNASLDGNSAGDSGSGKAAVGEAPGAGATVQMRPGQWEMTTRITRISAPNMPAGVNAPLPEPQTASHCLTPEQAARPNGGFWAQNVQSSGCTSENNSMAGGRIQARLLCNSAQGRTTITMDGRYTGDSLDLTQRVEAGGGGQSVTMDAHITGRRTGDCRS